MTFVAAVILVAVLGAVLAGVVVVAALTVGSVQRRREWAVVTGPIAATGPGGELQEPQHADHGAPAGHTDDAADTVIAVVGTGITPFVNRAPLSVPRTEHSKRHG